MEASHEHGAARKMNAKPDDGEWFRMSYQVTEALYSIDGLNKNHLRLILYIVRMTWGWNRKTFIFDTGAAIQATGIPKNRMTYLFKPLVQCNVIMSERGEYGINKRVEEWDIERLSTMTEGQFRKAEQAVPKNGISSEKRNSEFRKTEQKVPKNGTPTGSKPADDAALDAPKDNKDNTKDNTPLPPRGERRDPMTGWDEFWSAYPKKAGKEPAKRKWRSLSPDDETISIILEALETQKRSEQWRKDGGQFIPLPATWLNQKRWEDELSMPAASGQPHIPHNLPLL